MTTITIVIDNTGKPIGSTPKDEKAWARFKKMLREAGPGELMTMDFWFPRNGKFHRLHMAMIAQLFDAQEQFDDSDKFRKWVEVGAGYCEFLPGPSGKMVAMPKSISYKSLDDEGMAELHEKVKEFCRSERYKDFLYPHLSDADQAEMVESIIQPFERN